MENYDAYIDWKGALVHTYSSRLPFDLSIPSHAHKHIISGSATVLPEYDTLLLNYNAGWYRVHRNWDGESLETLRVPLPAEAVLVGHTSEGQPIFREHHRVWRYFTFKDNICELVEGAPRDCRRVVLLHQPSGVVLTLHGNYVYLGKDILSIDGADIEVIRVVVWDDGFVLATENEVIVITPEGKVVTRFNGGNPCAVGNVLYYLQAGTAGVDLWVCQADTYTHRRIATDVWGLHAATLTGVHFTDVHTCRPQIYDAEQAAYFDTGTNGRYYGALITSEDWSCMARFVKGGLQTEIVWRTSH